MGFATANASGEAEHLNFADEIALSGYDPVSYFDDKPVKGIAQWTFKAINGGIYIFASKDNLETFKAAPEEFLPAYGGWCAYAMLDGDKMEVDPMTYKIVGDRLYFFYNGFWGVTLKKWNKKLSKIEEIALIGEADRDWRLIFEASN
ncbi:MAG: YHS domain protein [Opitutales bacterium]|jgi:YHS domain-containing protein|nr:YHS domain protein [Opitutales bacterium]